jgi:hypothetical protein
LIAVLRMRGLIFQQSVKACPIRFAQPPEGYEAFDAVLQPGTDSKQELPTREAPAITEAGHFRPASADHRSACFAAEVAGSERT